MEYIYIGKLQGTHGLKGEIRLKTSFKYIDKVLIENFKFYIGETKEEEILKNVRTNKDLYLISFMDIESIEDIEKYVNKKVYINKEDLELQKGEYLLEDLLNKEAIYNDEVIGKIVSLNDYGNNVIMEIKATKTILVPCNDNFIEKVTDKVYLKNMEVFINEN